MNYFSLKLNEQATLECYIHSQSDEMPLRKKRPAVLIVPGGGYEHVSDREGEPVASSFFAKNFHAFVLHYSTGKYAANDQPLLDISKAIVLMRSNANAWGLERDKIAVCGFSAGGHLAASSGIISDRKEILNAVCCKAGENKPNAMLLCYPVITSGEFTHRRSFENLGSGKAGDAVSEKYSLENFVTPDVPPVFLWHTTEDCGVPVENALLLISALRKNKVPFEAHLFETGAHGASMGNEEVGRAGEALSAWFELSVAWLCRQFDFHT